jgi:hypothetical protein
LEKVKAGSRPQYYRIRRMVQMVREGAGTGYLANSSDFMKEFEVSRRTVARDLDFLRDEERAPLVYDDAGMNFSIWQAADGTWQLWSCMRNLPAPTRIYRCKDPLNFGINDDQFLLGTLPLAAPEIIEHEGQTYIASLLPSLKGIRIAKLEWTTTKEAR